MFTIIQVKTLGERLPMACLCTCCLDRKIPIIAQSKKASLKK